MMAVLRVDVAAMDNVFADCFPEKPFKKSRRTNGRGAARSKQCDISEFVEEADPSVVANILHTMPADDVTRILSDLPIEKKEELLNLIEGATSADVERLLEYEEKTAGAIMTPNFFSLRYNCH